MAKMGGMKMGKGIPSGHKGKAVVTTKQTTSMGKGSAPWGGKQATGGKV